MNTTMLRLELRRILRDPVTLFFTIGLPVFLYYIFGASQDYRDDPIGNGNVGMVIMVGLAAYGAVGATVSIGGRAALERSQGWGRQLGLTPLRDTTYVSVKSLLALVFGTVAVALIYVSGALSGASATTSAWIWSAVVLVLGASVFSLYGLCFGLAFGSEAALGGASGSIVVLAFLGNVFIPLSGTLLAIAKWTPLYGYTALARYPVTEGLQFTADDSTFSDPLWLPVTNVVVWFVLLAVVATVLVRRGRGRV